MGSCQGTVGKRRRRRQHDGRHWNRQHSGRRRDRKPRDIREPSSPFPRCPSSIRREKSPPSATARDNWLPLICTLNLTLVTEHIRKSFGWDYAQLEEQIRSVPAGCDGLLLLPYLTGERTPDLPNGTGRISRTYAREFYRSAHGARGVRGRDSRPRLRARAFSRARHESFGDPAYRGRQQ